MGWKWRLARCDQLDFKVGDLTMIHNGMVSIFANVFTSAEPQLNLRWTTLLNQWELPHVVTPEASNAVAKFAASELSAMVLRGNRPTLQGLPRTQHQVQREKQMKENADRRAAAGAKPRCCRCSKDTATQPPAAP